MNAAYMEKRLLLMLTQGRYLSVLISGTSQQVQLTLKWRFSFAGGCISNVEWTRNRTVSILEVIPNGKQSMK